MSLPTPPRWADRFLDWFCRPELLEEIQGDVYELFDMRCQEKGKAAARRHFVWDVLRSFRLSTLKKNPLNLHTPMLRSHVKIAFRHLIRQKFHTLINVGGLALGIACCLLIATYVQHELSYDQHHPLGNRIYRVLSERSTPQASDKGVYCSPVLAQTLIAELPEVENAFRLRTTGSRLVRQEGNRESQFEESFIFADPSMLDMLDVPLQYGNASTALANPQTLILSAKKARQYFPGENPLGKRLFFDNNLEVPYEVKGVLAETSAPTHLAFDFYLSMEGLRQSKSDNWNISSFPTYVLLSPEADPVSLEPTILDIVKSHDKELVERINDSKDPYSYRYELQPLGDIYLHSQQVKHYGNWVGRRLNISGYLVRLPYLSWELPLLILSTYLLLAPPTEPKRWEFERC